MAETKINKNQAGDGIFTSDNLVAGNNIEIVKKINPYVIGPNTFALFHYNTATTADAGVGSTYEGFNGGSTPTEATGNLALQGGGTWADYTYITITDTQKHFGQNTGLVSCSAGSSSPICLGIPSRSNFNGYISSGAMTIDVWIKHELDDNNTFVAFRFLSQNSASEDRCIKFYKTSTKLLTGVEWDLTQAGTTLKEESLSETITFTNWNHYAFTYVLGENSAKCYGYVNGKCVLDYTDTNPLTTIATTNYYYGNPLIAVSTTDGRYYRPYLSELRISFEDCYGGQDFDVPTQPYTTGEDEPDIYQINNTQDISSKANVSLDNLTSAGKDVGAALSFPVANSYTDLVLGASGATYTAAYNGYLVFAVSSTNSNIAFVTVTVGDMPYQQVWFANGVNALYPGGAIPITKGTFTISYGGIVGMTSLRLFYNQGNKPS